MQQHKIGIIGAGPMAIYLVKYLMKSTKPLHLVIFERHDTAGTGMPYRQDLSPDYMLSNIFSREIPTIHLPLADWLRAQPAERLARWNIAPDAISDRAFYPRTLLGAYLMAQLQALADTATRTGHRVDILTHHAVVDIVPLHGRVQVHAHTPAGTLQDDCDQVILATGHTWNPSPSEGTATLVSPWPAANITTLPAGPIGILGSSLSAVDVAVALAHAHGHFVDNPDGLAWQPLPGHAALHITMVSKTGILPEADFFYTYPYQPLLHLTDDAVDRIVNDGNGGVLHRTFALLMAELQACDAAYVADLAMPAPTIAAFGTAYFARRQRLGAFRALRLNLAESRATIARAQTIPFRYALLRGHEVFARALPHITPAEWTEFRTHLLPVFADCYAAVPHLSLERLAALRAAGAIDILESGDDAAFLSGPDGGVTVRVGAQDHAFAAMVDARGQSAALPCDLAFPSLVAALSDGTAPLQAPFLLPLQDARMGRVFCLSMPQLLDRYPFSQGLPDCDSLSAIAVTAMLQDEGTPRAFPR